MEALVCSYSRGLVTWLTGKFPAAVELDSSAAGNDEIIQVFQLLLPAIEFQTITQGKFNLSGRIKAITGIKNKKDQLVWLLDVCMRSKLPESVKDELYGHFKIFVKWKLSNDEVSRTRLQLILPKQPVNQEEIKSIQSMDIIRQKLNLPLLFSPGERFMLLDAMKTSLALLYRETDPITFGDPAELEVFDMGRGLGIALVGMKKGKRLSLENYIGYMAFRNGVPIAYGGGWIWGQRCRVGISIYPSFRKGESAWLFAQVLRLYYQYYHVRHFIVRQNQFGEDNLEGLKTGAFWFYYKLGFRPQDKELEKLAGEEWIKIKAGNNYRSSLKTLRMYTAGPMEWSLNKRSVPAVEAEELSRKVSDLINTRYNCSRTRAIRKNNYLMEGWSLLLSMLDGYRDWNPADKKKLTELIYLKQAGRERDHIIGMQAFPVFWKGMKKIVKR